MSNQDKPEHPAPWRWIGSPPAGEVTALVDAAGDELISGSDLPGAFYVDDDGVRELIRLAPEMEAALRALEWGPPTEALTTCPVCVGTRKTGKLAHLPTCALGNIIAALDAARKAK